MSFKTYLELVNDCLSSVPELMPWDLSAKIESERPPLLLDVREPEEFKALHIQGSLNVPRGILESACDYGFEETIPQLAAAREREIVVICRSGWRSVLAARTMQLMGYADVASLKTGIKGWNDFEQPLLDQNETEVDIDEADESLVQHISAEQLAPQKTYN